VRGGLVLGCNWRSIVDQLLKLRSGPFRIDCWCGTLRKLCSGAVLGGDWGFGFYNVRELCSRPVRGRKRSSFVRIVRSRRVFDVCGSTYLDELRTMRSRELLQRHGPNRMCRMQYWTLFEFSWCECINELRRMCGGPVFPGFGLYWVHELRGWAVRRHYRGPVIRELHKLLGGSVRTWHGFNSMHELYHRTVFNSDGIGNPC
jgi:hypothetical protein